MRRGSPPLRIIKLMKKYTEIPIAVESRIEILDEFGVEIVDVTAATIDFIVADKNLELVLNATRITIEGKVYELNIPKTAD